MTGRPTWRLFVGDHDAEFVTVITYEVVRGKTFAAKNSRMVGITHVTRETAVEMLRVLRDGAP
jgi:hypothetical protein